MDKDQTQASKIGASEAEMAFSETLRQKAREGRPSLEDLMDQAEEQRGEDEHES